MSFKTLFSKRDGGTLVGRLLSAPSSLKLFKHDVSAGSIIISSAIYFIILFMILII
jgi:hypothetical protein